MNVSQSRHNFIDSEDEDNEPLIQEISDEREPKRPIRDGQFPKARHILGFLGFLGFANVYAMRVNLSVSIVAMVNNSAIIVKNYTVNDSCPIPPHYSNETNHVVIILWYDIQFLSIISFVSLFILARWRIPVGRTNTGHCVRKFLLWVCVITNSRRSSGWVSGRKTCFWFRNFIHIPLYSSDTDCCSVEFPSFGAS